MRYKKIFLVSPPVKCFFAAPPIGLGHIAAVLEQNDIDYEVLDMNLEYDIHDLLNSIEAFKPDLVGFSSFTILGHQKIYHLIDAVSQSGYATILGGSLASTFQTEILDDCQTDYVVKYEGEELIIELCQGKPLDEIKGLIFRADGRIVENPDREKIKNLNAFPFPKYHKFELKKYSKKMDIVTSRGCPYNCHFCQYKILGGNEFRALAAENIFSELTYWYKLEYRRFDFLDDNFLVNQERIIKLCDLIKQSEMTDLELVGHNIKVSHVNQLVVTKMKEAGFQMVIFGAESGSDKVLKLMNKNQTVSEIRKAVGLFHQAKIDVDLNITVGHPGENFLEALKTLILVMSLPLVSFGVFPLVPIPGTKLYKWVEKNNYFVYPFKEYAKWEIDEVMKKPVFATPEFPQWQRKLMLILLRGANYFTGFKNKILKIFW